MAPEYGATCGFFPVDGETLRYLRQTGREEHQIKLVEVYAKENGIWRGQDYDPIYSDSLVLDLSEVVPAVSGPSRPQDHVALSDASDSFLSVTAKHRKRKSLPRTAKASSSRSRWTARISRSGDGSVVIASITSCTNTSNPYVMIGAGLVARKARALGLNRKPWVKTSLAPGSQVVSEYLEASGLQEDLDAVGFNLVGYGMHDLHRQLRAAPARDFERDRRGRSGRGVRAFGKPQFRGQDQSGCARQLFGISAACRRLCFGGRHEQEFGRRTHRKEAAAAVTSI